MCGEFLFGWQEDAFADYVIAFVEEAIDRLEPEVGHPNEVGVGEAEGDAQTVAVRLLDVADFLGEDAASVFAKGPGFHLKEKEAGTRTMQKPASVQPGVVPVVRVLRLKRRRTNVPWIYSLYHADPRPRRRRVRGGLDATELEMAELEMAGVDFPEGMGWEGGDGEGGA